MRNKNTKKCPVRKFIEQKYSFPILIFVTEDFARDKMHFNTLYMHGDWWTCYNSTCSLTPGICPALWMLKSVGLLWKKPWGWNRCTSTPSPRSKDVSAVPLLPSPSDISIKVKTLSEREVNVVAMTPSKFSKLRLRKQERIPPNQQRLIRAEWFMQKSRSNWEGFEIIQDLEKEHNPFGLETER